MAEFIQVPAMKPIQGKRGWVLYEDLVYRSDYLNRTIEVPRGFESDLASVPKVVPNIIVDTANGANRLPAILHDYFCYSSIQKRFGVKQRHADRLFREALKAEGVGWFKRNVILWFPTRSFQFFTSPFKKTGQPPIRVMRDE